jgi:hypothetical protein
MDKKRDGLTNTNAITLTFLQLKEKRDGRYQTSDRRIVILTKMKRLAVCEKGYRASELSADIRLCSNGDHVTHQYCCVVKHNSH